MLNQYMPPNCFCLAKNSSRMLEDSCVGLIFFVVVVFMNTIPQNKCALFCISPLWHSESYFEFFLLAGSNLYSKIGYVCYIKEIAEVCECEFIHVNVT